MTFGLDHNTFLPLVEGGFRFNGLTYDITHNFWTPFEEQKIKLGEINSFSVKVFAQQKIRVQEFLFGIPQVGEVNKAELGIEVFYNRDGEIEKVKIIQKTNIIDIDSVRAITFKSNCLSSETDEKCVTTLLLMKFLEPLKHNVMAIKAIDFKGRVHITYLNEGFDISGDSLNPMNTKLIPGTIKYEGLIEITQTAKYSDIWVAKDGREFRIDNYGSFSQINQSFEHPIETGKLENRESIEFAVYKMRQTLLAQQTMDELCAKCSDESYDKINNITLSKDKDPTLRSDDPVLQEALSQLSTSAAEELGAMFEQMYGYSHGKVLDPSSFDNIDRDDRTVLDILREEIQNRNDRAAVDIRTEELQNEEIMNADTLHLSSVEKQQGLERLNISKETIEFAYYNLNQKEFVLYMIGQILLAEQTMDELCQKCSDEPYDKINNITDGVHKPTYIVR